MQLVLLLRTSVVVFVVHVVVVRLLQAKLVVHRPESRHDATVVNGRGLGMLVRTDCAADSLEGAAIALRHASLVHLKEANLLPRPISLRFPLAEVAFFRVKRLSSGKLVMLLLLLLLLLLRHDQNSAVVLVALRLQVHRRILVTRRFVGVLCRHLNTTRHHISHRLLRQLVLMQSLIKVRIGNVPHQH